MFVLWLQKYGKNQSAHRKVLFFCLCLAIYYQSITIIVVKKYHFLLVGSRKLRTFASGKSYTTSSL